LVDSKGSTPLFADLQHRGFRQIETRENERSCTAIQTGLSRLKSYMFGAGKLLVQSRPNNNYIVKYRLAESY
jgi:hypothetical protein